MTEELSKFDWPTVARLALTSRRIDEVEEGELGPAGLVTYQFSAKGHELGQLLLAQLLDRPADAVAVYYRSRPLMLGAGLTPEEALASDMARRGSMSAGRDVGVVFNMPPRQGPLILPMAGDVGSQFTPAAGYAQALQYRRDVLDEAVDEAIVVVCGGDGAVATNGFWSALTMATTLQLPLLFFIEDNGYAISVTAPLQTPGGNIATNLASFGGLTVWDGDGTRPAETAELVATAVAHVRSGRGPGLLRLTVPRLSGHSSHDNQAYKSADLLAAERAQDPIPRLRHFLIPKKMSAEGWTAVEQAAAESVADAVQAAQAQPPPEPATAARYVWAEPGNPADVGGLAAAGLTLPAGNRQPDESEPRRINMIEAVRRTLDHELTHNRRAVVFGEDVGVKGGVHTATMGLQSTHGDERVFDTSLSEEGIIGRAVGMALAGLLPVPEIQFRKYADPATEQLNNCGTLRWRTANRFAAPMVVRIPVGFGRKIGDPWHSVTGEATFAHAIGWEIAFPAHAADAVGLLRSALRSDNPTLFFEHRAQMDATWARRPYPGDDYIIPFGQAHLVTRGDALTVVTWGAMVERCVAAAADISAAIEIIDLRTIIPWDKTTVLESVRKTSRCLIVHEDVIVAGFGAEVAATIVSEAFLDLDAPVERLATPPVPIPFEVGLMHALVPTVDDIRAKMEEILAF